jgi:hypothetical protein
LTKALLADVANFIFTPFVAISATDLLLHPSKFLASSTLPSHSFQLLHLVPLHSSHYTLFHYTLLNPSSCFITLFSIQHLAPSIILFSFQHLAPPQSFHPRPCPIHSFQSIILLHHCLFNPTSRSYWPITFLSHDNFHCCINKARMEPEASRNYY